MLPPLPPPSLTPSLSPFLPHLSQLFGPLRNDQPEAFDKVHTHVHVLYIVLTACHTCNVYSNVCFVVYECIWSDLQCSSALTLSTSSSVSALFHPHALAVSIRTILSHSSLLPCPRHPHSVTYLLVASQYHTLTLSPPHTLTLTLTLSHPSHSHSYPHTFMPSHPHIITPSHPHTFVPSHPHIIPP